MPWGEPDPADPNVLVGVELPGDAEDVRRMAWAFCEEYAALGFDEPRILGLFASPRYAGPHQALLALGEVEIRRIVRDCVAFFSRVRIVCRDAPLYIRKGKEG
jgi:hypothetical protein